LQRTFHNMSSTKGILIVVVVAFFALTADLFAIGSLQTFLNENDIRLHVSLAPSSAANVELLAASSTQSEFWSYVNPTYHFSFDLPRYIYQPAVNEVGIHCDAETEPVEVTEKGSTITIGAHFKSCAEMFDPSELFGWTIYAASNIYTQSQADQFIQQTIDPTCKISGWPPTGDDEQGQLSLEPVNDQYVDEPDGGVSECNDAFDGSAVVEYSRSLGTLVYWDTPPQSLEFPSQTSQDGNGSYYGYDAQIASTFHFVYPPE
jgi:hypothetical protein